MVFETGITKFYFTIVWFGIWLPCILITVKLLISRKLFNLTKEDDVCQYVIKRPLPLKVWPYLPFK